MTRTSKENNYSPVKAVLLNVESASPDKSELIHSTGNVMTTATIIVVMNSEHVGIVFAIFSKKNSENDDKTEKLHTNTIY